MYVFAPEKSVQVHLAEPDGVRGVVTLSDGGHGVERGLFGYGGEPADGGFDGAGEVWGVDGFGDVEGAEVAGDVFTDFGVGEVRVEL